MQDYRRKSQPLVDDRVWLYGALFCIFLIAVGLAMNAFDAAELRDLTAKIADLEPRRQSLYVQLPTAEQEYVTQSPKYAKHWSDGFDSQLSMARSSLDGSVQALQAQAQQFLDQDDRDSARSLWDEADKKLRSAEQIINMILGPPSYYSQLKAKSDAVDNGFIGEVQQVIDQQASYVARMSPQSLCGRGTLSYQPAMAYLDQAQSQLDNVAKVTLTKVLPEGIVDKPLVYDQAQQAADIARNAKSTADNLLSDAQNAPTEIASCQSSITRAEGELWGAYDSYGAQSNYDSAVTEKQYALEACYVQDFSSVSTHVQNCISYANQSYDDAQPPPPTQVPYDPPDTDTDSGSSPSYYGGDDSGSGGGDCCGSDDGFGGYDSQDSGDGFGGSDSQDSGDGF